jgi:thiamine-monophosphate kinase
MFDFTPRVLEAMLLHERYKLHAAIDISDGIALDASRLAAESGCGAVIFTDGIPISPDAFQLAENENAADRSSAALNHALGDGQDFELLFAVSPDAGERILRERPVECAITHVGELVSELGLWQQRTGGSREPLEPLGWRH